MAIIRPKTSSTFRITQRTVYLRAGLINNTSSRGYIANAGSNGYYWSSVVNNANNGYNFYFNTGTNFNPSNTENRFRGLTIRCVPFQS